MKKNRCLALLTSALTVMAAVPQCMICYAESENIGTEYRTPAEIKAYFEAHPFNMYSFEDFETQPDLTSPYENIGRLSGSSQQNGLNALNFVRFTAGLSEVTLNEEYCELAQAASYVSCINNTLTHYPQQPDGVSDNIYSKASQGASSSNLSYNTFNKSLAYSVIMGYMYDSDQSNISRVGHRRWCLYPYMGATGFGSAGNYSGMYAFDRSGSGNNISNVCWPARNTPLEYYPDDSAWSISTGKSVDIEDLEVTVTRKYDSKQWKFSRSSSDGEFYVENSYYGSVGCIIFRPDGINCESGDSYDVKITGTPETIEYTVNFFSLNDVYAETGSLGLGDVNYDGRVDASDASSVLVEYSLLSTGKNGNFNSEQTKTADINSDGKTDASDSSEILVYYSYASTTSSPVSMENWLKR